MTTCKQPKGSLRRNQCIKRSQTNELLEQVGAVPWASLWSLSLAVGGLFLLGYFYSIEYLPDADLDSVPITIVSVSLVGLFVVFVIGLGLTLPTLFVEGDKGSSDNRQKLNQLLEAGVGIVTAFLIVMNASYTHEYNMLAWVEIPVVFVIACLWLVVGRSQEGEAQASAFVQVFFKVVGWVIWAVMVPMLYYGSLAGRDVDEWLAVLNLLVFPLAFAVLSIVVAYVPAPKRTAVRLVAGAFAVLLLSSAAGRPALVPQISMAMLGLSIERQTVTLILSEDGCHSVNLVLSKGTCEFHADSKLGTLKNARVISRVGTEYVIHWEPEAVSATAAQQERSSDDDKTWRRAILKKDDVVSLAYDFTKKKGRQKKT